MINDTKFGKGTIVWSNGSKYEGNFYRDKFSGEGKYWGENGDYYSGQWKDGK